MAVPLHPCRCFVPDADSGGGLIELPAPEARHLGLSRRVEVGTEVTLLNGRGLVASARVVRLDKRSGEVEVLETDQAERINPEVTLAIGALKQSAWDELLKHAVELGVSRVVRVQTRNAVADVAGKEARKRERWVDIMVQACKQSGNPWLPELVLAGGVEEVLETCGGAQVQLLASLTDDARPLAEACSDLEFDRSVCWVGPEGDFTRSEREAILAAGAVPVSLGRTILRAETAGLALLAWLRLNQRG